VSGAPVGAAMSARSHVRLRPPRVTLHALAPAPFGGLERVVQSLAAGHALAGAEVHTLLVQTPDQATPHPLAHALTSAGVHVHTLLVPSRAYGRERQAVADLCRRIRPDIVHTHGYRADVIDAPAARRCGVATLTTVHGFTRGGWRNRTYEWLQRRAFRSFDAVVCVSRPQVSELRAAGVSGESLHLVPNALPASADQLDRQEARRALGLSTDALVIGWVGRLTAEKGPDVLVDAVLRLPGDYPALVAVVGDGGMLPALKARVTAAGRDAQIRWLGAVDNAGRLFAAFDGFVLSSRTEGTPIALLEAIAAGVPVAATAVGGVPDVITPAEGLLVPSEDPDGLARALRQLCEDRDGALRRARAAAVRLETHFSLPRWLNAYADIYDQVLATSPRR
jgi:glycosyltransferase involved in cell wall biosynthesis